MNMKRILVLVMTFAMLVSTFAPTLGVFADYVAGNGDNGKDGTLDYVSLGDSMTNGIGMDGYDTTDNPGTDNDGRNGYLEAAPDAYPAQFAEWLKGFTGKDVNLTQLATSGARAEDVWYILNHGTENAFDPDPWTEHELLWNSDRWGDPTNQNDAPFNDEVAATHRDAFKNADIISYAAGNGNFGVFFMGRVMNLVGFGSADDLATDRERYGYMTVENALKLCAANEEVTSLVMDVYNKANDYLVENGMPADMIVELLNYLVYTTASYVVTFMKTMDYIAAVNPDATVMILPLINNGLDFNFDVTLHGITKHFNAGDFLGALYTPINVFMAAYTAALNETGASENTYYYAELPVDENGETIQVQTYAQAFDTLYAPIEVLEDGTVVYPESRKFCHHRFYEDIIDFVFPILGLSGSFTDADIVAYETAQAQGTAAFATYAAANPDKAQAIGYYLGIIDAVLSSIQSTPNVNVDEISVAEGGEFSIFSILGPIVGDLQTTIYNKVEANAEAVAPRLAYELIAANITPSLEPYFSNDDFLAVFGADLAAYGDDSVEKTLCMMELALNDDSRFDLNGGLQAMKAALVDGYNTIANGLSALAMVTVLPETLSTELTSVGLLEALLALYGRLKLAWGLSAHPSAVGHDTLTQSLIDAYENEYTTKDETIENIKETIDLAIKVTDKAYQEAYDYVDEAGYINKVVSIVNRVINRLKLVDLSDNGPMTEEFRALLEVEVDATIATLEEIKDVLANDKADDLRGLLATLYALLDDVVTHLNNIYALCAQAGIDVTELVIIPALKEALVIIETELIPALNELVEEFVEAVIAHVTEKAEELYNYALGLSKEVYLQLVALVVRVKLHVEEKVEEIVDAVLDQYFAIVAKLEAIYGTAVNVYEKALEIYNAILDKVLEIKANVEGALEVAVKVYTAVVEKLYEIYGDAEYVLGIANKVLAVVVENLPAILEGVENGLEIAKVVFTTVYDFLVAHGEDLKTAFEVAVKVYTAVVEFLVENAESVEKALEIAGKAFEYVLEAAAFVYENAEEIYAIATKVYATLVDVIAKVYNIVETTIDVYNFVYDILVNVFGSIEHAICIAGKVCKLVVEFIQNTPELLENAYQLYCDIYDLIVEVYGKTADAEECAKAVYTYVVGVLTVAFDEIKEAIYNASNGDYTITEDSFYLALGNAEYAEELANMLFLGEKYAQLGLTDNYLEELAKADLVTVKFNNGEFYEFAYVQVLGMLATIVRESDFYASNSEMIDSVVAQFGIDMNAEAAELDWSKYLDDETLAIFQARLDKIGADLVAAGIPAVYELDLAPVLAEYGISSENGLIVEIPVAELVAFAIENAVYAYAETAARVANTLDNIYTVAPNATVVITGINNPLALYVEALESLVPGAGEYVEVLDDVVEFLNVPLYACAVANNNTVFVLNENAEDIYAALHAHCAHAYDDCVDTVCNICGETRVAPGHVWGEWVRVEEPTTEKEGLAERTCEVCGCKETKPLDKLPPIDPGEEEDPGEDEDTGEDDKDGLPVWTIVAIAVGSVAVACGAGAAIYWFFIKKKDV